MARIRSIKPDFFVDEDIGKLQPITRIIYEGLWCHADRSGRLEYRPEYLKTQIVPYDNVDIHKEIETLCSPKTRTGIPFTLKYEVEGVPFLQIIAWEKHQRPHPTETNSTLPEPPKDLIDKLFNGRVTVKERLTNGYITPGKERKGKERKGMDILRPFIERWNAVMDWKVEVLNKERQERLSERLDEKAFVASYDLIMTKIKHSHFLSGRKPSVGHSHFKADFDWVIANDKNYVKILEGKYDNKRGGNVS